MQHGINRLAINFISKLQKYGQLAQRQTLSRSLVVRPSLRTFPIRSTSNALVARMRLLAVGVGKVFSNAAKKACVWKGGLVDGRGSPFIVEGTLDLTRDVGSSSPSIASLCVEGLSDDEVLLCGLVPAEFAKDIAVL